MLEQPPKRTSDERLDAAEKRHDTGYALTPRERQVLTLIAAGQTSKPVAGRLGITFKTVVVHRYHLQQKLKAHNIADLTRAALRMGLIEL